MENHEFFTLVIASGLHRNISEKKSFLFSGILLSILTGSLAQWVDCSPMNRETWVQFQVASHQRLLKWYLIPPSFTLSSKRYVSRVKWSHPGKGVVPSPTPRCSSYWKGSLLVTLNYGRQLILSDHSNSLSRNGFNSYTDFQFPKSF